MRVDEDQRWHPMYLAQPFWNFINACFFEYGIAAYDLELGRNLRIPKEKRPAEFKTNLKKMLAKIRRQATKDYVVNPALALPFGGFLPTLAANFAANVVRNIWSHSVIMCGHFPEGVETFEKASIPENETRGEWYLRQMLGSANISGSKFMHLMSGNLSHQIEHHLFPDLPSNRYAEIAPKVQALFEKYGLNYCTRPMPQQVYSAWHKVVRLSLPNGWLATTNAKNLPSAAQAPVDDVHQGPEGTPGRAGPAQPAGWKTNHQLTVNSPWLAGFAVHHGAALADDDRDPVALLDLGEDAAWHEVWPISMVQPACSSSRWRTGRTRSDPGWGPRCGAELGDVPFLGQTTSSFGRAPSPTPTPGCSRRGTGCGRRR